MRKLILLLWLQFLVGIVGLYLSFWSAHSCGLGMEWTGRFQREFEQARALPDYVEPPVILGYSYERVVKWLQDDARYKLKAVSYCFYLSGGLSLFSVGGLILVAKARRQFPAPAGRQKAPIQ